MALFSWNRPYDNNPITRTDSHNVDQLTKYYYEIYYVLAETVYFLFKMIFGYLEYMALYIVMVSMCEVRVNIHQKSHGIPVGDHQISGQVNLSAQQLYPQERY